MMSRKIPCKPRVTAANVLTSSEKISLGARKKAVRNMSMGRTKAVWRQRLAQTAAMLPARAAKTANQSAGATRTTQGHQAG